VPENDRHAIDRLYEKGEEKRQRINRFCQNARVMSEIQAHQHRPWLEMYCIPQPPLDLDAMDIFHSPHELQARFSESVALNVRLPGHEAKQHATSTMSFDVLYSGWQRVVLEQRLNASPADLNLSVELYYDGRCKMFLPFSTIPPPYAGSPRLDWLVGKVRPDAYLFSIVDGRTNTAAFYHLLVCYIQLLAEKGWENELLLKYRLSDVWRSILFFDCPMFEAEVEKHGVPVCHENTIDIPDSRQTLRYSMAEYVGDELTFATGQWGLIAGSLGILQKNVVDMLFECFEHTREEQTDI